MVRKKDSFWQHVEPIVGGRFRCNYCGQDFAGGIPRVKSHLSGIKGRDINICSSVPTDVQVAARESIKIAKRKQTAETSSDDVQVSAVVVPNGTNKRPRIDSCSGNFDDNFSKAHEKNDSHKLDNLLAKFAFLNDVDFSVIQSSSFIEFVNALAEFGCGYKLPSYRELKSKLITDLEIKVAAYVRSVKSSWERTGCTLTTDVWYDDMEGKCYINIMSQCPAGLLLLGAFEISKSEMSSAYLSELVSFVIQNVGAQRVVQFIESGSPLVELPWLPKPNHVVTTTCSSTEIQMLFENIYAGVEWVRETVDRVHFVVGFIYKHGTIFSLVKKYANTKELKQSRMTEFSSAYEMLQSFTEVEGELLLLVKSSEWFSADCDAKEIQSQVAEIIEDENFWSQVREVLMALEPLFHVLCLVNTNGSTSGYLYAAMEMAEVAIERLYDNNSSRYQSLWDTFNLRKGRIVHLIHAAAAFLNPAYICSDTFKHCQRIKDGMNFVLENLVADEEENAFLEQMHQYCMKAPEVFTYTAMKMLKTFHPCEWWDYCGDLLPILRKYALRILSQPCSSSASKRSLSAFEAAQVKRRRRSMPVVLEKCLHMRLNATVMAKSNSRKAFDRKPIDLKELGKLKSTVENSAYGSQDEANGIYFNDPQTDRPSFTRNQLPESNYLQLHIITMVSSPLVTGQKVEGERGSSIHVLLVDPQTGFIVPDGALSKLELVVSVLEGDFNEEAETDWSSDYFQSNEITTAAILAGDLTVVLGGGIGTLGNIAFNEDSSAARNGKFKLGVKISSDDSAGFRIREGISNAFIVKCIEATPSTNAVACDLLLPDDMNPPYNSQGWLMPPSPRDYDETIYDQVFLWSYSVGRADCSSKSKQAATRWFKLKAVLQWAILRRIVKRKRARRMIVKTRVKKRLDECSIGQNWNAKEDGLSPVSSPTQMFFTGNIKHEDDEKDVMEPIDSKLDAVQMGRDLTIFPTLLNKHSDELTNYAREVLTNPKAKKPKVVLERDASFRSTITDGGSMTLFPSLLTAYTTEPTENDLFEPNSDGHSLCGGIQGAESCSSLRMLEDGVVRQCMYDNDYFNNSRKQECISNVRSAEKRWRKLKYVLWLALLWKTIVTKSVKEWCAASSKRRSSEQAAHCVTQATRENDCLNSAHKQEDEHRDKSWWAAKRWRELRAVLWFALLRTMKMQSQGSRLSKFSTKESSSTIPQSVRRSVLPKDYVRKKKLKSENYACGNDCGIRVLVHEPKSSNQDLPPDDGYSWRKYGQKGLLNHPYRRSYYHCTHRNCWAKKTVQRLKSDPSTYEVFYEGQHTCVMSDVVSTCSPSLASNSFLLPTCIMSEVAPCSPPPLEVEVTTSTTKQMSRAKRCNEDEYSSDQESVSI